MPSAALIVLSLGTVIGVSLWGRHVIQHRGLREQAEAEVRSLAGALEAREEALGTAASAVGRDKDLLRAWSGGSGAGTNWAGAEACELRERFDLQFVQVHGEAGTGTMPVVSGDTSTDTGSDAALLNLAEPGKVVARVLEDRIILLAASPLADGTGSVVVATDLASELERICLEKSIAGQAEIVLRGLRTGAQVALPPGAVSGWVGDGYAVRREIRLAGTNAELLLARPNGDAKELGRIFLVVTTGSSLLVGLGMMSIGVLGLRSLVRPIRSLSSAARAVADGGYQEVRQGLGSPLLLGEGDELGELVVAFNAITCELRGLRLEMEEKVEERTLEMWIAAAVARAVSSSLDLEATLHDAADTIRTGAGALYPGIRQVGIYLIDERAQVAVLEAVSADEEADPRRRGLRIPIGCSSPVGLAAARKEPEVMENARVSGTHLKPPLLMDTLSAAALPLRDGETLLGVLELQSTRPRAFGSAAPAVLCSVADQIGTAIRNARLFEAERRKGERLGESNRLRSHLLTVMSHKFRAPLNTIIGLSGALLDTDRDELTDRQRRDIGLIHSLGRHLGELTDDLLDPRTATPTPFKLEREGVDLRLLIESAIHSVRPLLDLKGLEIAAHLEPGLPVIWADKRRVRQVLLRLLSRLAARTESGSIDVRAGQRCALDADRDEVESFVEVSMGAVGRKASEDTLNKGMPPSAEDGRAQTERRGLELDLPVTEAIVDLHGGQFWADGDSGDGGRYTFILPVGQIQHERRDEDSRRSSFKV